MALIDAGLRGALIALLLLLAVVLAPHGRHPRHATLVLVALALLVSLAVQALSASPWAEYELSCAAQAPGIGISLAISVLFWLFAHAVFDDDFRLRAWHGLLWAGAVLLGSTVCLWRQHWALPGFAVMRALPVVFSLLALVAVARPWRADLVERRRRWRAVVVAGGALYAVVMVGLRLGSDDGRLGSAAALSDVLMMLGLVAWVASRLLVPRTEAFWEAPRPAVVVAPAPADQPASAADPQDDALARALAHHMGQERGYAQEGLSLAGLAARLGAPEYRLRRVINQRLGHRNFNAFVNGLRLVEAKRRLADPAERQLPVLSIALDVGFASIGPFNRAFKAETGLTPTEFRQQTLAES